MSLIMVNQAFLSLGPAMQQMIQSPPQITSPSLQQQHFSFPSPAIPQAVNPVRPVTQPPAVIPQQPSPSVVYMRNPGNEIQPTQIMASKYYEFLRLVCCFENT